SVLRLALTEQVIQLFVGGASAEQELEDLLTRPAEMQEAHPARDVHEVHDRVAKPHQRQHLLPVGRSHDCPLRRQFRLSRCRLARSSRTARSSSSSMRVNISPKKISIGPSASRSTGRLSMTKSKSVLMSSLDTRGVSRLMVMALHHDRSGR